MSAPTLNLFPARVPIGRVTLADGTDADVMMTPEFFRALSLVFARLGGPSGMGSEDLAMLSMQVPQQDAGARQDIADLQMMQAFDQGANVALLARQVEELQGLAQVAADLTAEIAAQRQRIDELQTQLPSFGNLSADLAAMRQFITDVEVVATYRDPFRVDWERPGAIGSLTAAAGTFTALRATSAGFGIAAQATIQVKHATASGIGAMADTSLFLGTTGNNNETAQMGFGFNNGTLTNATVSIGYLVTLNTGVQAGDLVFATRSVNTDTAPTVRGGVTRRGNWIFGALTTTDNSIDTVQVTGSISTTSTLTTVGGATFHTTSSALANGAGAGAGTITNAPAAGNPTKWIGINDNGTTRYIPAW